MARAMWNEAVLAEALSEVCEQVEGNVYFPANALDMQFFRPSETHTVCPWKGTASYYDIVVGEEVNHDAAWYYPTAKAMAKHIEGRVAFWRGVQVEP